jgi:nucleotide-binding universal stress UspA family protein
VTNPLSSRNSDQASIIEAVSILPDPPRRVLVAIDECRLSHKAIPHALAVANALDAELELVHVLESALGGGNTTDPIAWRLLRQAAHNRIQNLLRDQPGKSRRIDVAIEEGRPATQICRLARELRIDLIVVCTHGSGSAVAYTIGSTARAVINYSPGSVLIIPAQIEDRPQVRFRRIIIPLDGSSRAESVLPMARRIAEFHGAELILAHAIPEPELTEIGPPQPEDEELRASLNRRNERVARKYLDRVRAGLSGNNVAIHTLMLTSGDARHLLMRAVEEREADLIVLSSHGHSGHVNMEVGSVASHLSTHAPVPVLLVRSLADATGNNGNGTAPLHSSDCRFVARAAA